MDDFARAPIATIVMCSDGQMAEVSPEVNAFAADLAAINPDLRLRLIEQEGTFVVYQEYDIEGSAERGQHLVTTWDCEENGALDQRLLNQVAQWEYDRRNGHDDIVAELHRVEDQREREAEAAHDEKFGPIAEKSVWALRRDLGVKERAFIGSGLGDREGS